MNFDANRLAKLSGLSLQDDVGMLAESKETEETSVEEAVELDETAGVELDDEVEESAEQNEEPLFELAEEDGMQYETKEEDVNESIPLSIHELRETVLELRNEILAEQEAEDKRLAEEPVRSAIRKEIQSLLAEMPVDEAENWMYGAGGKPA